MLSHHSPQRGTADAPSFMARLTSFVSDVELTAPLEAFSATGTSTSGAESAGLGSVADTVQQAMQTVPMHAFEVNRRLPLLTPVRKNVSSLSEDPEGFRQLQRELCLLVCILQRPRSTYAYWLGYTRFTDALYQLDLVESMAEGMERLCEVASQDVARRSSNVFATVTGERGADQYAQLLRRYSEALLLYVFYHSTHAVSDAGGGPVGGINYTLLRAMISSTDEPPVTEKAAASIFRVAQRLASEESRCHQGSALMLACVLSAPHFQCVLPFGSLREAAVAASTTALDAVSNLVLVASVPYWVLGRDVLSESDGDAATVKADAVEWLRTAMEVCVVVTVYDVDVSPLFRHDGTSASTFRLVKSVVGEVYESLWNCVSPNVWYLFSKAALWSAARSMGMYAFVWGSVPRALAPLLSLLQFQLGQFARSRCGGEKSRPNASEDSAAGPSTSAKALNSNFNALLSGAMGVSPYEPSAHSVLNSPDPDVAAARRAEAGDDDEAGNDGGEQRKTPDYTMAFSFNTERTHTAYYLAVYAYAMSALPFLCECFGDVQNTLQWTIPAELYQQAAPTSVTTRDVRSSSSGGSNNNADASVQDTLSRASGWLRDVSDFSVDLDQTGSVRSIDVHTYLTFPMQPRFTERGKVNLLAQLMELMTTVAQSSTSSTAASDGLVYRLSESALALLHSLLSCYPREVSAMSAFAHVDLLSTLQAVALWQLSLPFPTFHAQELVYSLLHRYFTVFPNMQTLTSRLLKPEALHAVGRQPGVVERLVLDDYLYAHLVTSDEDASGVFVQPILAALCQVPEGMIASTMDGGHLFVRSLVTLLRVIRDTPNVSLRRVFDEAPLDAAALVRRCCEGLLFLYKQWVAGNTYMDNLSTVQLLDLTLAVLSEALSITKSDYDAIATFVMASASEPYEAVSLVDPATSAIYAVVRLLFNPTLDSLNVVERAAELLALVASHVTTPANTTSADNPLFHTLHSSCSKEAVLSIAKDVLQSVTAQRGQLENVHRLEALAVVQRYDWSLFHFLTGSESLPENANVTSMQELVFFKRLRELVTGSTATRLEQAAALTLMRGSTTDDEPALLTRVSGLLEHQDENPLSNTFEAVALTAACVDYMNVRTARGIGNTIAAATSTSPLSPQQSTRAARESSVSGSVTPSRRGVSSARLAPVPSSPSTPRHTFTTKLDREQSDAVDKACRGGTRALQDGLAFLTKLLDNLFYEERVSLIGTPGLVVLAADEEAPIGLRRTNGSATVTRDLSTTAAVESVNLSRAGGAAFSPIVAASTRSAITAPFSRLLQDQASLQLPAATQLHKLSDSLWNSAGVRSRRGDGTVSRTGARGAHRSAFHTSVLPDPIADEEQLYVKPYPLVLGTTYCFQSTEDDIHFNAIASAMEAIGQLSLVLENTIYLSSRDPDRNTLFLSRTLRTLEVSLQCLLVLKPAMPLLNRTLWTYISRCLRLVLALCRSIRTAHTLDDGDASEDLRTALNQLGHFAVRNRHHVPIVSACLEVAYSLPPAIFADRDTLAQIFTAAQFALVSHVADVSLRPDVVALVYHVSALAGAALANCPAPTLVVLVQSLWKHAENISHVIVATEASGTAVSVLTACVQCLTMCLHNASVAPVVLSVLPRESVVRMVAALGQFRRSEVYDVTHRVYGRQSWHTAWVALLELLHTVVLFHPSWQDSGDVVATADDWPLSVAEALTASPRFSQAVSVFDLSARSAAAAAGTSQSQSNGNAGAGGGADAKAGVGVLETAGLFVWDVEEVELCTRLVATLSAVGHHMPRLFPLVQNGFVSLHRFRILRHCTATDSHADVVAAESRRVEVAVVRTVRDQLRCLLQWPTKAMPTSDASYPALSFPCFHEYAVNGTVKGAVVHQRDISRYQQRQAGRQALAVTGDNDDSDMRVIVEAVSLSMDVLRRFIVDELQLVRRLSAIDPSAGGGRSPDGTSTRPQSRESSVTQSPALGGRGALSGLHGGSGVVGDSLLYDDAETVVTDDDSGTIAGDTGVALHVATRVVHIECVQLALALFTAAATECLYGETVVSGHFDSLGFQRDLLGSVNKLLDALDSVHKDIRKTNSPVLAVAVDTMRMRLRTIKTSLLT